MNDNNRQASDSLIGSPLDQKSGSFYAGYTNPSFVGAAKNDDFSSRSRFNLHRLGEDIDSNKTLGTER